MTWQPNPGHLPRECELRSEDGGIASFRPVHVRLFNGFDSQRAGHAAWPSAGRMPSTNWRISTPPHPFQIQHYEAI